MLLQMNLYRNFIAFLIFLLTCLSSFATSEQFNNYNENGFSKESVLDYLKSQINDTNVRNDKVDKEINDILSKVPTLSFYIDNLCFEVECEKINEKILNKVNKKFIFLKDSVVENIKLIGSSSGTKGGGFSWI